MVPVRVGDHMEIAVTYYSLRGLVDVQSIQWLPPVLLDTPEETVLTYRREKKLELESDKSTKLVADLGRVNELEDSEVEWRPVEDVPYALKVFRLAGLRGCFQVQDAMYSNVDIYVLKLTLLAVNPGMIKHGNAAE